MGSMKRVLLALVKSYQKLISPLLGVVCLYQPTCSQYAVEKLEEEPTWKALPQITLRLLSCNPINGYIKYKKVGNT